MQIAPYLNRASTIILTANKLIKTFLPREALQLRTGLKTMTIATTTSTRASGGFMRRAFDRMIEARSVQARRYVNGYLLSLDDATLSAHGYDREQLEREGSATSAF